MSTSLRCPFVNHLVNRGYQPLNNVNKPFHGNRHGRKWGTVLGDEKLAAATIDRVVHHGRLVEFGGPSRRMGEALMLGKGAE